MRPGAATRRRGRVFQKSLAAVGSLSELINKRGRSVIQIIERMPPIRQDQRSPSAFGQRHGAAHSLSLGIFFLRLRFLFCSTLRLLGDPHHVISMRLSGPKDLIRHSYRESRAPFKLSLRAPLRAFQIDASGWWVKPPSSGSRFVNDN
jgi:hypothetical protein